MVSKKKAKSVLNKKQKKYTDKEIKIINETLGKLATIEFQNQKNQDKK